MFNLTTGAYLSFSVTSVPADKKPLSVLHWIVPTPAMWLKSISCKLTTDVQITQATPIGLPSELFPFWEAESSTPLPSSRRPDITPGAQKCN